MSHKFRAVEGGQLFMHRLRMFKQTMRVALAFSAISVALVLLGIFLWRFDWYDCYTAIMCWWAKAKISMQALMPNSYKNLDIYLRNKTLVRIDSFKYINDFYVRDVTARVAATFVEMLVWAPILVCVNIVGSFIFFGRFSKKQRSSLSSKQVLRGQELIKPSELASKLRSSNQASDLQLDDLPLVKDKETSHILITGTTGSGKTNCLHTLLPQIRKRGNSAIVIDTTGDLVARYYRKGQDIILNPLDQRGEGWNLWQECNNSAELESFAEAFIPHKANSHDPFWETASRKVLVTAIDKLRESQSIKELYDTIVTAEANTYHHFFAGTEAASYTDKAGERMTLSIRANLTSQIACLKSFGNEQGEGFSIRQWVRAEPMDQWLFITASPTQRALLRPLLSAWLNTAINSLMSVEPNESRRTWLIIDELPSLNKIPSLKTGLAELRKYGGCVLAGVQSYPQLIDIYGQSSSQAMQDLFNTKLMFRTTDPSSVQWVAKLIGETEYAESQENLSFGANSIRDGVSLSKAERIRQNVLPSEVANLSDLECFVKYPGNYPSTKLQMTYKSLPKIAPSFEERIVTVEPNSEKETDNSESVKSA